MSEFVIDASRSPCTLRAIRASRFRCAHDTNPICRCRQEEPEKIQKELEEFLKSHGVNFSYSGRTKFANFRHRTLL